MLFRTPEVFIHVLLISSYFLTLRVHSHSHILDPFPHPHHGSIRYRPWHIRKSMSREFLQAHNNIRAKYGLPPLIWDRRLAHYARRHASKLVADCSMVHSVGRYGENLFWGRLEHWTPARIVEDWGKESEYFDMIGSKCMKDWTECGHFTQIVWADTTRVGCYRRKCMGIDKGYIGICNYDPPGNVVQQSPFIRTITFGSKNTPIPAS